MVDVRSYFKKREKRDSKAPRINYMEKIKSHKFMIFYRSVLIFVLVAAVAAAFVIQWKNKIYVDSVVLSSTEIALPQSGRTVTFSGHLLTYSKDGASCIDTKGVAVWNETFEMQNPMIDICQDVVAIGDYNGRTLYVMNTGSVLGEIVTNKPIRNFCVAANGVVAVVLDDSDVTWICLYDTAGEELVRFRTTMKDSGYPFKVAISPNGRLICVSYLFVDSGELKSSVAFYNFGAVGQNNTDHYVSGFDYQDAIVGYARFLDDKTMFAVSDDRIMFFGGEQKPVSIAERMLDEDVEQIFYGKEHVGLVFLNTDSSNRYRLDVYNKTGDFSRSIEFDIDYSDIVFSDDQIIIYNESECRIYNMGGVEKYAGHFEKAVHVLIPTSSSYKYMLVTSDSVDIIELK
ncbi:MAG: DUF5711 family protein [Blautia sp.]|nr:DUF5711 family protein [Lachnoclostridium sp.]MCM1209973.1 DUF5711 family protein [Blautia sp.]